MNIKEPGLYKLRCGRYVTIKMHDNYGSLLVVSDDGLSRWDKSDGSFYTFSDTQEPSIMDIVSGPYKEPELLPPPEPEFIEGFVNVYSDMPNRYRISTTVDLNQATCVNNAGIAAIAVGVPFKFPNPKFKK